MTATEIRHETIKAASATHVAGAVAVPNRTSRLMILLFMLGMVLPVWFYVGPLLLMPHRVVLLVLFVPLLIALLSGKAGRIRSFDILMMASSLWAVLALGVNGSVLGASVIQQMGIYTLEAFGAYLLGRVTVRSREDFTYFTKLFFITLLILVPFGVMEAVTHKAIMLKLLPFSSVSINAQEPRWGLRRAQTIFAHPILFGVFCSVGFGLFWHAMRSKLTRMGGTMMAFAGTFVSLSSGAFVSIVIQAMFMAWEAVMKSVPRRWLIFSILAALAYLTIDLLSNRTPFHVLVTYATFNTGNSFNRILIWQFGMENVWANPIFGLGANIILWQRPVWMSSSADNYWLLLAMQYGIPCFMFLAAALFIIIRRVALAPLKDPLSIGCRAGYLTAVGGLIIAGGTVHYWHGVMAFVMFFIGSGVWAIDAGAREQSVSDTAGAGDDSDTVPSEPDLGGLIYTRQPTRHSRTRPLPASAKVQRAKKVRGR